MKIMTLFYLKRPEILINLDNCWNCSKTALKLHGNRSGKWGFLEQLISNGNEPRHKHQASVISYQQLLVKIVRVTPSNSLLLIEFTLSTVKKKSQGNSFAETVFDEGFLNEKLYYFTFNLHDKLFKIS